MGDPAKLAAAFASCPRREIKVALLDQSRIAGLGNIYAAEVLWHLRINPQLPVGQFTCWRELGAAVHHVLRLAIKGVGTTIAGANPYRTPSSEKTNGYRLAVYGRTGQPCYCCATPISQFNQANRTTFYCGKCQV